MLVSVDIGGAPLQGRFESEWAFSVLTVRAGRPRSRSGRLDRVCIVGVKGCSETASRAVQPPADSYGRSSHHLGDLRGGESFALGQKQDLAVARVEGRQRIVDARTDGVVGWLRLWRLGGQSFLQPCPAGGRPRLVGDHPPRCRIQPRSSRHPSGNVIQPPPGDQEHLCDRIVRVAGQPQLPPTVRPDSAYMFSKQRIKAPPPLKLPLRHILLGSDTSIHPCTCPATIRTFAHPRPASPRSVARRIAKTDPASNTRPPGGHIWVDESDRARTRSATDAGTVSRAAARRSSRGGPTVHSRGRRVKRRLVWLVSGLVIAVAIAVGVRAWNPFGAEGTSGRDVVDNADPTGIATVSRRTLSSQSQVGATLGYAGSYTVINQAGGGSSGGAGAAVGGGASASGGGGGSPAVFTSLPWLGKKVGPGQVLYRVNGDPVVVLTGRIPAYRGLSEGMTGADVRQLNADLVALGYATRNEIAPTADEFSWETADALERLQAHVGVAESGTLALGDAVFLPAAIRVTGLDVMLGGSATAGMPVLTATSTRREVTIALDPSQQSLVRVGDRVEITLPNNRATPGVITNVGKVASTSSSSPSGPSSESSGSGGGATVSSGSPTITVVVRPAHPARTGSWDQAAVEVTVISATAKNVLAVPVAALLALETGGYAVEEVSASGVHLLVRVRLGLFDDAAGLVQVSGPAVAAGQRVVVPAL